MKFEIGFIGILTIVFVLLRAFNIINWSWWWVFSPLWISTLIIIFILMVVFILIIIGALINK